MQTLTVNFLNNSNKFYNRYDISQDECYNKLKQLMKFTNSKYEEIKLKLYRIRDITLVIDQNEQHHCYMRNTLESYINDNLLINVVVDTQISDNSIPKLKKYNSVINQKKRKLEYKGITIYFVEERTNDNNVINYIELKTSNSKLTSNDFKEVISLISCTE